MNARALATFVATSCATEVSITMSRFGWSHCTNRHGPSSASRPPVASASASDERSRPSAMRRQCGSAKSREVEVLTGKATRSTFEPRGASLRRTGRWQSRTPLRTPSSRNELSDHGPNHPSSPVSPSRPSSFLTRETVAISVRTLSARTASDPLWKTTPPSCMTTRPRRKGSKLLWRATKLLSSDATVGPSQN
eukprot:scaffold7673_cov258-Pinguiococcus_pyrenoidosus.AAC.2